MNKEKITQNEYYTFDSVRIVMVSTSEPGNIGAAARALKNMYLSRLYLVNPKNYPCATATVRASGADDILQNAIVCDSLEEAISDCHLVIGASARQRSVQWQQVNTQEASEMIRQTINPAINKNTVEVAVVFGAENSGLSNIELDLCQVLMHIPANPVYSSLNIAQAIQVFTYTLSRELLKETKTKPFKDNKTLANSAELEYFYKHLEQVLNNINYLDSNRPDELMMRRLRKIFHRTHLYKDEVAIFRGILNKISQYKD